MPFGDTVAEMETDFSEKMADIEKRMKDCVDELDVSVEAGAAGAATIEGLYRGRRKYALLPGIDLPIPRPGGKQRL